MQFNACRATAYFFPDFAIFTLGGVKDPFIPVRKAIGMNGKKNAYFGICSPVPLYMPDIFLHYAVVFTAIRFRL